MEIYSEPTAYALETVLTHRDVVSAAAPVGAMREPREELFQRRGISLLGMTDGIRSCRSAARLLIPETQAPNINC